MSSARARRWAVFAVVAVALVFALPWVVPPLQRVASESYMFGFSNAAAVAAFGLLVAALAAPAWLGREDFFFAEPARAAAASLFLPPGAGAAKGRIPFLLVSGAIALLIGGFWLESASSFFGESSQFFHGIDAVLLGRKPYADFVFPYGPLFLYAPLALSAVTAGAIKVDLAYVLVLLAEFVAGLWMLDAVVRRLDVPRGFRVALFVLVALAGFNLTLGENYTPFRFLLPFAAVLLVSDRLAGPAWIPCAVAAGSAAFAALVSPEMALVTVMALSAVFVQEALRGKRVLVAGAVAAFAGAAVVAAAFSREYLFSLFAFGAGGYNFPVLPTAHILLYLASAFFALPLLLGSRSPLGIGFGVAATLLGASALGRCDPGHVYWSGMMAFVAAAALLAKVSPRAAKGALAAFAVAFTLGVPLSFWNDYSDRLHAAFTERARLDAAHLSPFRNGEAFWSRGRMAGSPFVLAKMPPPEGELRKLERYSRVGTPIAYSEEIDRFLKLTGRFVPERVPAPLIGILNEQQLQRKLEDVRRMDVLLFPDSYQVFAGPPDPNEAAARSAWLSRLLLFPVSLKFRREPFEPERAVVQDILARFHPVDRVWDYQVMVQNSAGTPTQGS